MASRSEKDGSLLEYALDRVLKEPEVTNILMARPRGDRVLATDKTSAAKT